MKVILIKLLPNISNFLNYPCQKLLEAVFRRLVSGSKEKVGSKFG